MATKKSIKDPKWIRDLQKLCACPESIKWCRTKKSYKEAWDTCTKYSWMLWLIASCTTSAQRNATDVELQKRIDLIRQSSNGSCCCPDCITKYKQRLSSELCDLIRHLNKKPTLTRKRVLDV